MPNPSSSMCLPLPYSLTPFFLAHHLLHVQSLADRAPHSTTAPLAPPTRFNALVATTAQTHNSVPPTALARQATSAPASPTPPHLLVPLVTSALLASTALLVQCSRRTVHLVPFRVPLVLRVSRCVTFFFSFSSSFLMSLLLS